MRTEIVNDQVFIYYDLVGDNVIQTFEVKLFGKINNYSQRLFRASGDVGTNIKAGKNKKILWNNKIELTSYDIEEINFDIKVTIFKTPISIKKPKEETVYTRRTNNQIEWLGGENNETFKLELYQDGFKLSTIGNISNKGQFNWRIPTSIKPGNNYQVKITSDNNPENSKLSQAFTIKRKIPMVVKVLGGAAVLGLGYFLISDTGDSEPTLPAPPDAPGGN